jgi:arylsulfatase A-like enzyme
MMLNRRDFLRAAALGAAAMGAAERSGAAPAKRSKAGSVAASKPNIVFILADDLGIGDLGCYGQKRIKTPNVDRLAAEGVRYTQGYCGTSVCAPCRCSLMTGQHMGHAPVRANREIQPEGQMPLPAGTFTVAQLLKSAGYATACIGKWGLGMFDTTGSPLKNGFDHFFGYNCQRHAHSYFPTYLYRNAERFELDGKTYAQNLIAADALDWVKQNKDRPFFLYYALTLPHGKYEIDDVGPYANEDWPDVEKTYAAMVTRMDRDIGRLMELLKELGLDDKTIVFFASDNGAAEGSTGHTTEFFDSNGPYRSTKRSMYEGGLRVPLIARWPGHVPAGKVSDVPWAFWDFLPTCAELVGARVPAEAKADGLSVVPALMGGAGPKREYFYWELHEAGRSQQAVRFGDWKAVKNAPSQPVELYDLKSDPVEANNVAAQHPDLVEKAAGLMKAAHVDSPDWPMKDPAPKKAQAKGKKQKEAGKKQ